MTRIEKIRNLLGSSVITNIDPYKCSDKDLDRLLQIKNLEAKGTPRSTDDWKFVNQLSKLGGHTKPIGKFSK